MDSWRKSSVLAVLLICVVLTVGSAEPDSPGKFVEIKNLALESESYSYLGQGRFLSLRSCRIPWICLQVDTCTFDHEDSTLHLAGTLCDCMERADFSTMSFEALVGAFEETRPNEPTDSVQAILSDSISADSLDSHNTGFSACLGVWKEYDLESSERFVLNVKVTPDSYLFIVPAIPDTASSSQLISSAIFDIGQLIRTR